MAAQQVLKTLVHRHFCWKANIEEAERVARRAVQTLKRGGEQTVLAEALTTHGKALARLNQTQVAKAALDQAVEIAQIAGNPDRGGIAAVTAIEELSDDLPIDAFKPTIAPLKRCSQIHKTPASELAWANVPGAFSLLHLLTPTRQHPQPRTPWN